MRSSIASDIVRSTGAPSEPNAIAESRGAKYTCRMVSAISGFEPSPVDRE